MPEESKPILVTGATGSIGSALVKRLSETGAPIRALVRDPARAEALHWPANVEVCQADLTRPESLHGCADGCGRVYHCAARLAGTDRKAFQAVNVGGTMALTAEAIHSGVERFIYLSTIGVYGTHTQGLITEDAHWSRENLPYFATKQQAERAVRSAEGQIPLVVARLGDVYGPGQFTWTIDFIQKINRGLLHPPLDRASGTLNPVYISNLIDALVLLGKHPAAAGEVFNLVDSTPIKTSDYIRRMAKMAGKNLFPVPPFVLKAGAALWMAYDRLQGREPSSEPGVVDYLLARHTISAEKIRGMLGWHPAIGKGEAFRRTEAWLRKAGYIR